MLRTIIILLFAVTAYADNLTDTIEQVISDNNSYRKEAAEFVKEFRELANTPMADEGRAVAKEMMVNKNSYINTVAEDLGVEAASCIDPEQLGDPHIYVFVSSSMPEQTLKNYADTMAKLNGDGIMLLRGIIGDPSELKPTLDFILKFNCGKTLAELQKNNEQCNVSRVDINPNLFKVFDVKEVPAIAWTNLTYADLMGMKSLDSSQYGLIYGDVSVEHALQKFAEKLPIDTKPYMKKLKEGYFD